MVNQFNIHSIKLKSSEAIKRDEQRNFSEALKQYGACMLSLGQLLKEDNLAEELKSNAQTFKQVSQALKICKMCFERVSDIVDKEIPNSSSGGNTLTPNNSFGIGVTGNSNLSTSMINIPSSGFNSSSSSSLQQIPTSMNSSFHFSNRSSITSTTSNTPSDVNSLRSSMTFNTPPPISNNMPFSNGSTNPSAPSLPSTNLQPNISNNSSPTISPQLSNSPIIQSTLRQSTSSYGRDSLQSAIQPPLGTMSNRSSVQLSGPVIEFQPPPGAITPRINSPLDSARNRASVSLSDVSTFGVDPSEKRKSIKLGEAWDGESTTFDGSDGNPWNKLVSSKFVSIYTKERTFKTRDELFDRELSLTESPEDQWAMIRSHISEIADQVSQHPINNLLIHFTQKFNAEFQKQEDTAWLNVGEANKQIADLATAIVNSLEQYWSSLQSMELRHYITKAFAEGVMKRVYRTLVEVYETQNQNKEIEGKLEDIGPVTFDDLGVDDEGILRSADLFEPAIIILDNLNIGKTPYATLDTLVNFHKKIVEICNQVTDYSSLSDTTLYGLLLYIMQLSNTKNIPSTLDLVHDYIQEEEMSDEEKTIIELLENVIDWASQFEV
ncbi:predicted protein [Naegleria gruberi]|uniref:Predicted protein n=1 Tax=Naegleria gruberi TaxID=5762 RepID=D2VCI8_NAEGR|nr:uncharacterized protein NAEGRDRAFT_66586 [Naegleria gruberi]EFC45424.1 predicted protein [Naegleria gruberi]|eukprot:XP_002678168.1 predicted protein [Naegleria gruberi strain NEG-M]